MKPITFFCIETLPLTPEQIAGQMLDLPNWMDFTGYGVLPGIKAAVFEVRTPNVVGTRIKVMNTDGSSHVEEIVEWEPDRRLRLDMKDFSPPLSRLATGFVETWDFERLGDGTRVVRSFTLHPKSFFARSILWLISFLLKRAVARHLRQMRGQKVPPEVQPPVATDPEGRCWTRSHLFPYKSRNTATVPYFSSLGPSVKRTPRPFMSW